MRHISNTKSFSGQFHHHCTVDQMAGPTGEHLPQSIRFSLIPFLVCRVRSLYFWKRLDVSQLAQVRKLAAWDKNGPAVLGTAGWAEPRPEPRVLLALHLALAPFCYPFSSEWHWWLSYYRHFSSICNPMYVCTFNNAGQAAFSYPVSTLLTLSALGSLSKVIPKGLPVLHLMWKLSLLLTSHLAAGQGLWPMRRDVCPGCGIPSSLPGKVSSPSPVITFKWLQPWERKVMCQTA